MVTARRSRGGGLVAGRRGRRSDNFFETYGLRILRALRQIIHAVDTHSRKLNQEFRITTPQLICLLLLERQGPTTLSRLARDMSLGASTANGIVDRLEAKGLLTRTRSRQDRRKVELAVTEAGRDLLRRAPSPLQARFREALRGLPEEEQAAMCAALERVVELMDADGLGVRGDSLARLAHGTKHRTGN